MKYARVVASCGGIGFVPFAPGTCASIAAAVFQYLLRPHAPLSVLILLGVLFFVVGWIAVSRIVRNTHDDPSWIVIDEWAAQWFLCLLLPHAFTVYVVSIIAFRFFDIVKPWPISRVQQCVGALGVMADDILAAVAAGILLCCWAIPGIL